MKRIKMALYGEPGVGKSTFAAKAPKPFFITTDGNYEWLDLPEKDHIQVNSWEEAKKAFAKDFTDYETIVVDLTEDLFKWCEAEFCVKNRIDHVSDIGYGKGYDITRNNFFIEMCKLIGLDKNIIFIMHGITTIVKDRRGVEHTKYVPTSRIPDKVLDMLEGRLRYFLRCYLKAEENSEDNTLVKKRYLSLIPKENEFGICRGIDENAVPHDIPLDFNIFAKCIGLDLAEESKKEVKSKKEKVEKTEEKIKEPKEIKIEKKIEENVTSETQNDIKMTQPEETNIINNTQEEIKEIVKNEPQKELPKEEVKKEVNQEIKEENKEISNDAKLDAIRAKLARLKAE